MSKVISPDRIALLSIILSEPTILPFFTFPDAKKQKRATKFTISDNGTVVFYCGWGWDWVQRLMNDYESVDLLSVSMTIVNAITGQGETRNDFAFDGMTKAILDNAIKRSDYDCVIDILWDSLRHSSGTHLQSKYLTNENLKKYAKEHNTVTHRVSSNAGDVVYAGIRQADGRVIPIRIGTVVEK